MLKRVNKYLESVTPERPKILKEMEAYAKEKGFPIIGPLVGRYLYQQAMALKARNILELGSGFGYSAFWFSMALLGKGKIVMTDSDRTNKKKAFDYFKRAGLLSQFDYKVGDAIKIASRIDGPFDIILNDIDKKNYPKTIDLAAARLRKGGLFITDNLLWSGKVMEKKTDLDTKGIIEFTQNIYKDSRFFTTILPIRDGLAVAVRV